MSLVANASGMIALKGATMTLNRVGETSITLKGRRIGGGVDQVGNADQQSFRVKIGTVELAASDWAIESAERRWRWSGGHPHGRRPRARHS